MAELPRRVFGRPFLVWQAPGVYRSSLGQCDGCGADLPVQRYQGMPRRWCSQACRLRAYRRRRRREVSGG